MRYKVNYKCTVMEWFLQVSREVKLLFRVKISCNTNAQDKVSTTGVVRYLYEFLQNFQREVKLGFVQLANSGHFLSMTVFNWFI